MKVSEAIHQRKSVRGYKKDRVPEALIKDILQRAQQAPSNCNTQPWYITVFSGEVRDSLEKALLAEITKGAAPSPAFRPGDAGLTGIYKDRQRDNGAKYFAVVNVERQDKEARNRLALKNWQFFGAPHVAIISMPTAMNEVNAVDVGIYLQTLMLLLTEEGIACCAQGALAFYPKPFLEHCDLPEGHGIICGLSFGYEDEAAPANALRMSRAPFEEYAQLIE